MTIPARTNYIVEYSAGKCRVDLYISKADLPRLHSEDKTVRQPARKALAIQFKNKAGNAVPNDIDGEELTIKPMYHDSALPNYDETS